MFKIELRFLGGNESNLGVENWLCLDGVELWNGCFGLGAVLVMASRVYDDRYGQKQRAKLLSFPRKKGRNENRW